MPQFPKLALQEVTDKHLAELLEFIAILAKVVGGGNDSIFVAQDILGRLLALVGHIRAKERRERGLGSVQGCLGSHFLGGIFKCP